MCMNTKLLKSIAVTLVLAVTWTTFIQTQAQAMLVPSQAVQTESTIDRSADIAVIQQTLESKLLREKLKDYGLNEAEIQTRLSRMSDQEVHQLASQIRAVNPSGFLIWVLTVVVLVLLVVFLIKRV